MPMYFFNVHHERSHFDAEGQDFPDRHAAWHEATITTSHALRDINSKFQPGHELRVEVTDEFANPLYVIYVHAERSSK